MRRCVSQDKIRIVKWGEVSSFNLSLLLERETVFFMGSVVLKSCNYLAVFLAGIASRSM